MSLIIFEKGASKQPKFNNYYTIVKIQKAFDKDQVLVYNKDQSFIDEFNGSFSKYLKGDLKGYFKVKIKNGNMRIINRVSDKNW